MARPSFVIKVAGHPRLSSRQRRKDVDDPHKAGHDDLRERSEKSLALIASRVLLFALDGAVT
ncbi:hypothetical protein, partial [Parvibaculum sp.]|uniref:hypothetical protein n=1 Tax=Parvibaculum sp. TaxID=2024848 RepID=UPI0034A03FC5